MNPRAKWFIGIVTAIGLLSGAAAIAPWRSPDPLRFGMFLILAVVSSGLRVTLPSIPGTLSAVFVFQFISIIQMTLPEALTIACFATLAQNIWMAKVRPTMAQIGFNISTVSLAVHLAFYIYRHMEQNLGEWGLLIGLLSASLVAYFLNTSSVATVIALVNDVSPWQTWRSNYLWSFPYYLAGGALAGLLSVASSAFGWQTSLLILPVVFLFYRSYTTYTGRLEDAKNHAEEVSALHLRTIESLALAIEAKDDTTHAHLRRVQTYALALGEELGLEGPELAALRAAAILHDIGKLAVPEHIICKPGKLTPEEFEKMKIHPVVGAEILEHVKFPYPVAPIVLSHHEKWNGAGYPYGLKGDEIPIGARILAAVDCLDALASDRQYRKALPIEEAMNVVRKESGKSFDPQVVELLDRRYLELEKAAQVACHDTVKLSTNLKIERGAAPAAGFESSQPLSLAMGSESSGGNASSPLPFNRSIAEARHEVQALFDLANQLNHTLSLQETLSLVAQRLKPLIPHETVVLWVRNGPQLEALYCQGANRSLFESLRIPIGEGLTGWVVQNEKPILNGNPAVEPGYLNDPSKFTTLRSALAAPLSGIGGFSGALAFYSTERDAFQKDHLRILLGISSKLAISVEQTLQADGRPAGTSTGPAPFQVNDASAPTGLPGPELLISRFEAELARAGRAAGPLAVLICDVDGLRTWNARLGFATGDALLRKFAAGLRAMFREYDTVAHLGGDEFAVVIPGIHAADLQTRVREMQILAMETGKIVCSDTSFSITIGEAYFPKDGVSVEELMSQADRRLSLAKRQRLARRAIVSSTVPAAEAQPSNAPQQSTETKPVGVKLPLPARATGD